MSNENIIDGINYGPLACLVGTWTGDKGMDTAPEPDGKEENPYYETILYEAIGDVTNAEKQTLSVLRYHQVVSRKSDDNVFHNETGYWMWDAQTNTVMHSLTIPRGVCLLAGGNVDKSSQSSMTVLDVSAAADDKDWRIIESPFMQKNARTVRFTQHIEVSGDQMSYSEKTELDIYGKKFDHTDSNTLTKTA